MLAQHSLNPIQWKLSQVAYSSCRLHLDMSNVETLVSQLCSQLAFTYTWIQFFYHSFGVTRPFPLSITPIAACRVDCPILFFESIP